MYVYEYCSILVHVQYMYASQEHADEVIVVQRANATVSQIIT